LLLHQYERNCILTSGVDADFSDAKWFC